MQLVNSAVCGYNAFDEIKYIKSVTAEDLMRVLNEFDVQNRVLSVIEPIEEVSEG